MGTKMLGSISLLLLVGAVTAVPWDELRSNFEFMDPSSTNLDEPAYRLLDSVQPRNVFVDLDVYLEEAVIYGAVRMEVDIREENLTQIVFHQNVVNISSVSLINSAGRPVNLQFPDPFTTDNYYELLIINLAYPIPAGQYTINVVYVGQINTNPVDRGFYRGYYFNGNQIRYYATTQFQPYHARKAFPCFDEPQFKSRFVISITRAANLSPSYSNMAINETVVLGNRVRETFLPTPVVSVYLVAFHVSDFVETGVTSTSRKPFQIISRPGVENQHDYAAHIGVEITNVMDDYFAIDYYGMGQGQPMKNDHIALPDFPSGAMENWGMVNYREAYLLYDGNNTNLNNKIFIATIVAHELAHKWFGNLVTCFWWSNLWLNESFASYFENFAAHAADPSLELDDQFVTGPVHSALAADAGAGATPMNWTGVVNNPSITAHFSTTSYAKGASVLRMIEHFIGPRNFRRGLQYYLSENAYGLGTPEDLYSALRRATEEDFNFVRDYGNVDVGAVLDSWVQNAGAPVLNVDVNMNTGEINLGQERFLVSGTPAAQIWQIPISWTSARDPDFSNTRPSLILTQRNDTIRTDPGHFAVFFNIAQSGLYRVNYDDHNWQMIAAYLRNNNNRQRVHKLNRAQIVNDVLFFIRAGRISTSRAFDVLSFLASETDYYVWAGAVSQLDWIRRRLEHIPSAHEAYSAYMLRQMDLVIRNLGYNEGPNDSTSTILNRMQILNLACELGHSGCISDSLQKWRNHVANPSNLVPVNLRRYVYCIGLREGNQTDYDFLFQRYNTSENTADMVVILRALACTRDNSSLQNYLQETMYNSRIRIHDRTNAFQYALQGNRENLDIVLNFLFENFEEIRETYGGPARLDICISALATFLTDFSDIQRFQNWLYANQVALQSSFNTGVAVVNTAMNNLRWGNEAVVEIFTELQLRSSASAITMPFVLMLAALIAHLLR